MYEKNNQVWLSGELTTNFMFENSFYGEGFYIAEMSAKRASGTRDNILIKVSERLIDVTKEWRGKLLEVKGEFRSFNLHEGDKTKLLLSVFVNSWREIECLKGEKENNRILLDGYVCKKPGYRVTPLGREIADILLAVNRKNGRTDYIPCISWGRNAVFSGRLPVGEHLKITGRIQSRTYDKQINEFEYETRTAYEVSISKIEILD